MTITDAEQKERLPNPHPGEILLEEFLQPLGLSQYRLAKSLGVPQIQISQIVRGKRPITPPTALRLGAFFRTSPEFWLNLQAAYDLMEARRRLEDDLARIEPLPAHG